MSLYYFKCLKAGDFVMSRTERKNTQPIPPTAPSDDHEYRLSSLADYDAWWVERTVHGGAKYRGSEEFFGTYTLSPDTLTIIPDSRRGLRLTPNPIEVRVGDAEPPITVELLRPDGTLAAGFNGFIKCRPSNDQWWRLNFTAGIATVPLETSRSGRGVIDYFTHDAGESFKLDGGPFVYEVRTTKLSVRRR